jgi:hypothetical protein
MEAIVGVTLPVVAAINSGVVGAVAIVRARIVGMTVANDVGPLHVSAIPPCVHYTHSVMFTHHRAPTVDRVINVHAVVIHGTNLTIGADARGPTAFQRNISCCHRRTPSRCGAAESRWMPARRRMPGVRGVSASWSMLAGCGTTAG